MDAEDPEDVALLEATTTKTMEELESEKIKVD